MPRKSAKKRPVNGHVRVQPRIAGYRRQPANTALATKVEEAIKNEMAVYNVSRSWVIASCCAYALGVSHKDAPDYHDD